MPLFRLVEGDQAGPSAVGILVPPGRRTLLIFRPRALNWDLIPVDPEAGTRFWEVSREFAARVAQEFLHALESCCDPDSNRVEAVAAADGTGYQVRASIDRFVLIVCARVPGNPYQPLIFGTVGEACVAAEKISTFLCPAEGAAQEVYLNTRHFSR